MRIKTTLVSGVVKEIKPNIYGVIIPDDYERAMLFCRYQEYYESPYREIRSKFFTLEDFMNLYRKKRKNKVFQYPNDWAGFNIPSHIIMSAFDTFGQNLNNYDLIMKEILYYCEGQSNGNPYYLIGVDKQKSKTMNHEIAHGLYYTNKAYKTKVDELISNIPKNEYNLVKKELLNLGYVNKKSIIDDEIQAFFSTGLYFKFNNEIIRSHTPPFILNFKSYVRS